MSLAQQLERSVARLTEAGARIDEARSKPVTLESAREWLAALTEYVRAASDIQMLNNESVHEKLHEIASRGGIESRIQ